MKAVRILIAALVLAGCSSLPVIRPISGQKTSCPSVFVSESTRFIHSIEVSAAGRPQTVMIGVTLITPKTRSISCAIVSPEGLSLFEATSIAGRIRVDRALPPFDKPDFARNMMDDIELIFLAPQGAFTNQGVDADGRAVCRWHREKGGWVDVGLDAAGRRRIKRYTEQGSLERTVTFAAVRDPAYASIDLQSSDLISYSLTMSLIESETVKEEIKQ